MGATASNQKLDQNAQEVQESDETLLTRQDKTCNFFANFNKVFVPKHFFSFFLSYYTTLLVTGQHMNIV